MHKFDELAYYGNIDRTAYISVNAVCESTMLFTLFLLDATLISHHIKFRRAVTCFQVTTLLFLWILDFFVLDENIDQLNWNPFVSWGSEISKYTNVNFKNLYISSMSNLTLFVMKPLFGVIVTRIKRSVCKTSTMDNNYSGSGMILIPSSNVYKKPYFYWYYNCEFHDNCKDSGLTQ